MQGGTFVAGEIQTESVESEVSVSTLLSGQVFKKYIIKQRRGDFSPHMEQSVRAVSRAFQEVGEHSQVP